MLLRYANSSGYKNKTNWQLWQSPIYNCCQQCLNSGADWSVTKDGQVLLHFQQIVTGTSTLPCPTAAVFQFLCSQLLVVGHWSLVIGRWLLDIGCWSLVIGCWLLVVGCWLLVVGCWLLVVGCWLLVVGCWSTIRVPGLWEISLQKDKSHTWSVCIWCIKKNNRLHLRKENDRISLDKCQRITYDLCRAASGESANWCQICPISKPFWVTGCFLKFPRVSQIWYFLFCVQTSSLGHSLQ